MEYWWICMMFLAIPVVLSRFRQSQGMSMPIFNYNEVCKCNRCDIDLDMEELKLYDSLPPMQGYSNYTLARCAECQKPVCEKCMWGLGFFMFTCRQCCRDFYNNRGLSIDSFMDNALQKEGL